MGHDEVGTLALLVELMHAAGYQPLLLVLVGIAQHTVVGMQFCLYALTFKLLGHHAGPGGVGRVSLVGSPHHQHVLLPPGGVPATAGKPPEGTESQEDREDETALGRM